MRAGGAPRRTAAALLAAAALAARLPPPRAWLPPPSAAGGRRAALLRGGAAGLLAAAGPRAAGAAVPMGPGAVLGSLGADRSPESKMKAPEFELKPPTEKELYEKPYWSLESMRALARQEGNRTLLTIEEQNNMAVMMQDGKKPGQWAQKSAEQVKKEDEEMQALMAGMTDNERRKYIRNRRDWEIRNVVPVDDGVYMRFPSPVPRSSRRKNKDNDEDR